MRQRRPWRVPAAMIAALTILAACASDGASESETGDEGETTETEAEAAEEEGEESTADGDDGDAEGISLRVATGGMGGTYFVYWGAAAQIFGSEIPGVANATAETTGSGVENIRLVDTQAVHIGAAQSDAAAHAFAGTGPFDGEPKNIRSIAYMYPQYVYLTTLADSGIENIEDFEGRQVGVSEPGSAAIETLRTITDILGISWDDWGGIQEIGPAEMTNALRSGNLDVINHGGVLGLSHLIELCSTHDISIVSFTEEQITAISEEAPYISHGTVPADTYECIDEDVERVPTVGSIALVSADEDEELVYQMTKTLYENRETLIEAHPAAAETVPENVGSIGTVPLHPGALRYYDELGIEVPESLMP